MEGTHKALDVYGSSGCVCDVHFKIMKCKKVLIKYLLLVDAGSGPYMYMWGVNTGLVIVRVQHSSLCTSSTESSLHRMCAIPGQITFHFMVSMEAKSQL